MWECIHTGNCDANDGFCMIYFFEIDLLKINCASKEAIKPADGEMTNYARAVTSVLNEHT